MAADPDCAVAGLVQRAHQVAGQAVGVVGAVAVVTHAPAARLQQVQAVAGAEPDPAGAVFEQGVHHRVAKAPEVALAVVVLRDRTAGGVVAQRAVAGAAQPQLAIASDQQAAQAELAVRAQVDALDRAGGRIQAAQAVGGGQP